MGLKSNILWIDWTLSQLVSNEIELVAHLAFTEAGFSTAHMCSPCGHALVNRIEPE